jgi:hypothetical protein
MSGGQAPTGYWISEITGTGNTEGKSVKIASNGDVYGCFVNSLYQYTFKLNTNGYQVWQRVFGSPSQNDVTKIAIDSLGNSYISGYNYGTIDGATFVSTFAKYDSSGVLQYQRFLNLPSLIDVAAAIGIDSSSNIYLSGYINASPQRAYISKFDSAGSIVWQRTITNARGYSGLAVDSLANVYISGVSGTGPLDSFLAKYDTSGTLQWQRKIGTSNSNGTINNVAVDAASGVYIIGSTDSVRAGFTDILIAKYDSLGTLQWQRALSGGATNNSGSSIAISSGNAPVVVGSFDGKIVIAKYDSSGVLQWQRFLAYTGATITASDISVGQADEICVIGTFPSINKIFTCKLRANGAGTGSFGSYTYEAGTAINSATSLASFSLALTSSTSSLTAGTPTLSETAGTLSQNAVIIA